MTKEQKELYVFTINRNTFRNNQERCMKDILKLLNVCFAEFELKGDEDKNNLYSIKKQEYTFETKEEARTFAIKVLETNTIFFCELNVVNVK